MAWADLIQPEKGAKSPASQQLLYFATIRRRNFNNYDGPA